MCSYLSLAERSPSSPEVRCKFRRSGCVFYLFGPFLIFDHSTFQKFVRKNIRKFEIDMTKSRSLEYSIPANCIVFLLPECIKNKELLQSAWRDDDQERLQMCSFHFPYFYVESFSFRSIKRWRCNNYSKFPSS